MGHAFEMLFKAAIIQRGGKITKNEKLPEQSDKTTKNEKRQTLSLRECLEVAKSQAGVRFISSEQADTVRIICDLRDQAQHHFLDPSEQYLYVNVQAGFTLFRDIYQSAFSTELNAHLPERALPISTVAPTDIETVFASEADEVRKLLQPGRRQKAAARAKIRGLAILENAINGEEGRPTSRQLDRHLEELGGGKAWEEVFPGVAAIELTTTGAGPSLDLRITKKAGVPVHLVSEAAVGSPIVAVKRVDSLGFYSLGRNDLAKKVGLTGPKTSALIWHLKLKDDEDCFSRVTVGKTVFDRYSQQAIVRLRQALNEHDIASVWDAYRSRPKDSK